MRKVSESRIQNPGSFSGRLEKSSGLRILFPKSSPGFIITTKIHSLSMLKIQLECKILKHSNTAPSPTRATKRALSLASHCRCTHTRTHTRLSHTRVPRSPRSRSGRRASRERVATLRSVPPGLPTGAKVKPSSVHAPSRVQP